MNRAIEIDHLAIGYDHKILVKDIELSVRSGEILALIGPNGSGKSTILKTITRALKKIDGNISILGKKDYEQSAKDIAKKMSIMMTEKIHPELMSCRDVVATGRYPYTGKLGILTGEDEQIVEDSLMQVHAKEIADKPFDKISDGQRQRVMLARALCQQPQILLLDEPTSFLDIQYKVELLSLIRRAAIERDIAVIMTIHELEFASAIADQVAAIDGDRISMVGTPRQVLTGENIEALFHMRKGAGSLMAKGFEAYSNALKELVR